MKNYRKITVLTVLVILLIGLACVVYASGPGSTAQLEAQINSETNRIANNYLYPLPRIFRGAILIGAAAFTLAGIFKAIFDYMKSPKDEHDKKERSKKIQSTIGIGAVIAVGLNLILYGINFFFGTGFLI